ncbi:nicotinamide riboside transporter PnuC [Sphingobacterium sp. SGR-19]|uniref:nicotinamide riboside transporter PnuC n=1 Tax=Sphingobacterium sp. SGR-19 TaxID=2710886 RepID=UPI0013EC7DF8|nr:nicotinamide riboside transporter PnuC [Sphingobacterium sp. SGR-19]NGM65263.1 nicotinamide mononucleotide transporter [Sphingobacterium sp. SGR-19]
MHISEFIEQIQNGFLQTSWLERLAVLFGIVQVLLSRKNKISNYFFGIIGICLTISVLYNAKLYAEILLHAYYLIMSIYGLWYWKFRNQSQQQAYITRCSRQDWSVVAGIVVGGYFLLFVFLTYFTDSDVPIMDAFVSSTAWAGMWLLAKRKIENWILLNISNFVAIPLLFHKELYLFACLTVFLFIVAISGYIKWKKIMSTQF